MRVVPEDGQDLGAEDPTPDDESTNEPTNGHPRLDALRYWLVSGVHLVDRRRRFGGHGRARKLLVVDSHLKDGASERWEALAAALHRHTVRGGLSELTPEERRVITLAYLEGRTNREIATMLGVSVTTARRRLWAALQRLDDYITRTGVWLTAFLVAVAAVAASQSARVGRWAATASASPERVQRLAAVVSAGVVTTAAVGIVAFAPDSAQRGTPSHQAAPPAVHRTAMVAGGPSGLTDAGVGPEAELLSATEPKVHASTKRAEDPDAETSNHGINGCHGNPTSAPPSVPVGPRTKPYEGAPVTHPGRGGCKVLQNS